MFAKQAQAVGLMLAVSHVYCFSLSALTKFQHATNSLMMSATATNIEQEFRRVNPRSDLYPLKRFHHIEFYCGDALNTALRWSLGLGMAPVAKSDLSTGNQLSASYAIQSGDIRFIFTAPYSNSEKENSPATVDSALQTTTSDRPDIDGLPPSEAYPGGTATPGSANTASTGHLPGFDPSNAQAFFNRHGLGAYAVGIEVSNAHLAYETAVQNGAIPVTPPTILRNEAIEANEANEADGKNSFPTDTFCCLAELKYFGSTVLRYVSFHRLPDANAKAQATTTDNQALLHRLANKDGGGDDSVCVGEVEGDALDNADMATTIGPFLPGYQPYHRLGDSPPPDQGRAPEKQGEQDTGEHIQGYGLYRLDHVVSNVWNMSAATHYLQSITGFHPFAEFTADDVGTVDSGLNSIVLASNNELVLLPINEPTYGTKRKSQIQTFLEQNRGPGVQHLALFTRDILTTMERMRGATGQGGFEFMKRPSEEYYRELPGRIGDRLSPAVLKKAEALGLLVDADDRGVLLQVFTKPVGDRPTLFLEIIQRVGCIVNEEEGEEGGGALLRGPVQLGGCGGFGKGNFHELFKKIEEYEAEELKL